MELLPGYRELNTIAEEKSPGYKAAWPYPHVVFDNFFHPEVLNRILEEFCDDSDPNKWIKFDNERSIKLASGHESVIPRFTRTFLHELNSAVFLEFLERLTGIPGLLPDPHLFGAGLHQTEKGGYLKIHADFNWYQRLKLHRRLNVIVYLNQDWKEEYGGQLELWDKKMESCQQRVLPVFNRVVIFNTTDESYHGHPEPLSCPEGRSRKSLALYYYTVDRPKESFEHGALFRKRPDEKFRTETTTGFLIRLVPPICVELFRSMKNR